MALFGKKPPCPICGGKLGLLSMELKDGKICQKCWSKASDLYKSEDWEKRATVNGVAKKLSVDKPKTCPICGGKLKNGKLLKDGYICGPCHAELSKLCDVTAKTTVASALNAFENKEQIEADKAAARKCACCGRRDGELLEIVDGFLCEGCADQARYLHPLIANTYVTTETHYSSFARDGHLITAEEHHGDYWMRHNVDTVQDSVTHVAVTDPIRGLTCEQFFAERQKGMAAQQALLTNLGNPRVVFRVDGVGKYFLVEGDVPGIKGRRAIGMPRLVWGRVLAGKISGGDVAEVRRGNGTYRVGVWGAAAYNYCGDKDSWREARGSFPVARRGVQLGPEYDLVQVGPVSIGVKKEPLGTSENGVLLLPPDATCVFVGDYLIVR